MGGLLYKDFVSINRVGKIKMTWIIVLFTLLFIIFRIIFPGTKDSVDFQVIESQGETINLLDVYFTMFYVCWIFISLSMISVAKIMGHDEKNKIKGYISALPLEKNTYVASKYIFVGISAYVMMSLDYIWGITCIAFCREGRILEIVNMVNSSIVPIIAIALLIAAISFPLYLSMGKEAAMRVIVVFLTVIALIVIGYLLFGDLNLISNWNIYTVIDFMEKHRTGIIIFQSLEPAIILILYYFSYRLSCHLYYKKEGEV